uniref:hexameric tyrosine-coordinated heme protein n=1 Tax=Roseovarius indicus TaxID=540747 RepID=UPI003B51C4C9
MEWKETSMTSWLPTLETATPEEGYDLAVKLARFAVKLTQPDAEVRDRLRPEYAEDSDALIAVSQVVATHFATVAAANGYWRNMT